MKVKIAEILEAAPLLQKLSTVSLPVKTSYNIVRNSNKIQSELGPFEKSRKDLVSKYGTQDDDGKVTVKDENMEQFYKEMSDLLQEELEIDIRKIKIDSLSEIKLTPNELNSINFLISEEE